MLIGACILMFCSIHVFTGEAIIVNLKAAMSEENKKAIRILLRFFTDLAASGIFGEKEVLLVAKVLEKITVTDMELESLNYIAMVSSYIKHCGLTTAGILSRKQRLLSVEHGVPLEYEAIFGQEVSAKYRGIFNNYFAAVAERLAKDDMTWQKLQRKNELAMELNGELTEAKQKETEAMQAAHEKLMTNCTTLADLLDLDMPALPELEPDEMMAAVNIDISNPFKDIEDSGGESLLWDDAETRGFYEKLTDLRASVPEMLFKVVDETFLTAVGSNDEVVEEGDEAAAANGDLPEDEAEEAEEDANAAPEELEAADEATDLPGENDDEWDEGLTPTDPFSMLIERLPTCINVGMIDGAAIEFCQINNKGNRKRLALALFKVRRSRLDLLPHYARLVSIMYPAFPEIAEELVSHLQGEFRFFVRKKIDGNVESKIKNIRFIGELTKFRVCPPKVALTCLTVLLRTFKHHDIDIITSLLDCCGRFLYRRAVTHVRIKHQLDIMVKKRAKLHLDERQNALINNALYSCNPPPREAIKRKVRPPLHEYFRYLIYTEVNLQNLDRVVKKLRRFPWNEPEFLQYALKCFVRVWKVKFEAIRCLASLLAGLTIYHENFSIMVVDATVEEIRIGMEINSTTMNHRRVCAIRYLAEMYNFRLIDAKVVFGTLYSLITYGCGHPLIDPPTNYFRCKLVCTVLDVTGYLFNRGKNKRHLDDFFVYFQRYLYTKAQPLPVDTEITVYDTLELLRPKLHIYETFEESAEAVSKLEESFIRRTGMKKKAGAAQKEASADQGAADEDHDDESDDDDSDGSDRSDDDDDDDGLDEIPDEALGEEAEEDGKVVFLGDEEEDEYEDPEDDEFVESFRKLLVDTNQARRNDTGNQSVKSFDAAIPLHLKGVLPKRANEDDATNSGDDGEPKQERFVFTLLTKKGGKQTTQELVIPAESGLADRMLEVQQAEMEELLENKKFVMKYEERVLEQEELERQMREQAGPRSRTGRRLLFKPGRGRGGSSGGGAGRFQGRSGFGRGSGGRAGAGKPLPPGMNPQQPAASTFGRANDRDYERDLMKDMGYGKARPRGNRTGTGAVITFEDP